MEKCGIPDYSAEPLVGELLEVLDNVDYLSRGVRILDEAVVSLQVSKFGVESLLVMSYDGILKSEY